MGREEGEVRGGGRGIVLLVIIKKETKPSNDILRLTLVLFSDCGAMT